MRVVKVQDLRPDDIVRLEDGDEVVDLVEDGPRNYYRVHWVGWARPESYHRDARLRVINRPAVDLVDGGGTDEHGGRGNR